MSQKIQVSLHCRDEIKGQVLDYFKRDQEQAVNWVDLKRQETGLTICCGGDGSLNHTVNQLMKSGKNQDINLCYFPDGTGNDFARGTGLFDRSLEEILHSAMHSNTTEVYPAMFNEKYYINMASCGEFARVTTEVREPVKEVLGTWSYALSGLGKLAELEPQFYRLQTKGGHKIEGELIGFFIGNSKYCGGGFMSTNRADIHEHVLDLLVIKDMPVVELIKLGLHIQQNKRDLSDFDVEYLKVVGLEISSPKPIITTLDGELYRCHEASIRIADSSIQIFLPEQGSD